MIIDCHNHCTADGSWFQSADDLVRALDMYGVDQACCSAPVVADEAPPDLVSHRNDLILKSMRMYPGRILGQCYVNPGYAAHAQDEITRCVVDGGMVGVKLYHQYTINDPVQFPVIERCIELGVHALMHAAWLTAPEEIDRAPKTSNAEHFADMAQRFPEAMLICGHVGGGGDWERQIKGLRDAPSVYLDTSGSVADCGMIERCVRDLGAERLLYGCDGSIVRGLGKILDADITERRRRMIFSGNFEKILARRKA